MSSPHPTPFRFLDLPKDIRFLIYDLITVVTRHHTITASPRGNTNLPDYSLTIISHRVPGISLLGTCRHINAEAVRLQRNITALNSAPLRIIADWQSVGGAAMKAILQCAAGQGKECGGSAELEVLLEPIREQESSTDPVYNAMLLSSPSRRNLLHRDFDTHKELNDILRRSSARNGTVRSVDIAVEYGGDIGDDMEEWMENVADSTYDFYYWVDRRSKEGGEELRMTLRVKATSDAAQACLNSDYSPFVDNEFLEEFWKGRTWGCAVRGKVEEEEMAKWWTEGEK